MKKKLAMLDARRVPILRVVEPAIKTGTDRLRGSNGVKHRAETLARAQYTCAHCGRISDQLQADHIIPLYKGGSNDQSNMQALCVKCHAEKSKHD